MKSYVNMESIYDSARSIPLRDNVPGLGRSQEEENDSLFPSLTFEQRLIGFACCFGLSFLLSIFAIVAIFIGDIVTFAVINTVANILCIGSTIFLCGPLKQLKRMFDPTRLIATIVYICAMVLTFVAAIVIKVAFIVIITVVIQYLAMIWYCLSYIPFARTAVLKFLNLD